MAPELVSVAKSYIGDHGPFILQECVQLHGGIGVTWDHDLHLYLRRVVQDRAQFGTPRDHRERVAAADRALRGIVDEPRTGDGGHRGLPAAGPGQWLAETMPRLPEGRTTASWPHEDEMGVRARQLQRLLFDGGFAGICFPVEYGGQGLTRAHQRAFTQESMPYQMPTLFNVPTLTILAPTLLDFGTEEQKLRHISGHPAGRRAVGAVPVRAERRFRPGRPGDPGHPGRRRLRAQRVEDLELGRLPRRLRHVPGPHRPAACPSTRA